MKVKLTADKPFCHTLKLELDGVDVTNSIRNASLHVGLDRYINTLSIELSASEIDAEAEIGYLEIGDKRFCIISDDKVKEVDSPTSPFRSGKAIPYHAPLSKSKEMILELLSAVDEMTGLEMIRTSRGRLGGGSTYILLSQMRDKGFVSSRKEEIDEDLKRVPRTFYRITQLGREVLNHHKMRSDDSAI